MCENLVSRESTSKYCCQCKRVLSENSSGLILFESSAKMTIGRCSGADATTCEVLNACADLEGDDLTACGEDAADYGDCVVDCAA